MENAKGRGQRSEVGGQGKAGSETRGRPGKSKPETEPGWYVERRDRVAPKTDNMIQVLRVQVGFRNLKIILFVPIPPASMPLKRRGGHGKEK